MRRRWLIALGSLLAAAVAAVLLLFFSAPKGSLRARYDEVRVGMTADEVHAIMRRPGQVALLDTTPDSEVYIGFDDGDALDTARIDFSGGRVAGKTWAYGARQTWLGSMRNRLGW
jgi:hypothetical protein